jgi:hypothetical protein
MAEKGQTRDPSSHRTPGQITRLSRGYNATPAKVADRVKNNQARAMLEKEGKVHKGDGKDVDHKKMLKDGGGNDRANLRVQSQKVNRGWEAREKK